MPLEDQTAVDVTPRTRLRRFPPRGHYDKRTIWGILDKAIVAHIGFTKDAAPAMLPMVFFRNGDHVYFHGASRNRMFGSFAAEGPDVCFTATVIDGFVAGAPPGAPDRAAGVSRITVTVAQVGTFGIGATVTAEFPIL